MKSLQAKEIHAIQPHLQLPRKEIRLTQPDTQAPAHEPGTLNAEETRLLFQRYAPSLFAYLRLHAAREDAEDLLHEIFQAAMEKQQFGQLDEAQQLRWLWRVARNKTVDIYRHRTRRPVTELETVVEPLYAEDEQSPERALLRREEHVQLLAALQRLPPIQQEALRLRFVNEMSCAEVARALSKREGAVRSLLSRAISRLRTIYTTRKEEI
jgi:RNA polymerase sigma-70 factor (ECF subfamily)